MKTLERLRLFLMGTVVVSLWIVALWPDVLAEQTKESDMMSLNEDGVIDTTGMDSPPSFGTDAVHNISFRRGSTSWEVFSTGASGITITHGIQSVTYLPEKNRLEVVQIVPHDPTQMVMRYTPHVIYKHIFDIHEGELHFVESIQGKYVAPTVESYSFPEDE